MKRIILSDEIIKESDEFATLCYEEAKSQGKLDTAGFRGINQPMFIATRGEFAWSVYSGIPHPKRHNQWKTGLPDFLDDIEIKTSEGRPFMILRTRDIPVMHRRFVHVRPVPSTSRPKEFLVGGWIYGYECKHNRYWGRPDPTRDACWSIHESMLRPQDTLIL